MSDEEGRRTGAVPKRPKERDSGIPDRSVVISEESGGSSDEDSPRRTVPPVVAPVPPPRRAMVGTPPPGRAQPPGGAAGGAPAPPAPGAVGGQGPGAAVPGAAAAAAADAAALVLARQQQHDAMVQAQQQQQALDDALQMVADVQAQMNALLAVQQPAAAVPAVVPGGPARVNANQLNVLGEFSGADNEDAIAFAMKVRQCQGTFGWTEFVTATMVELSLRGVAARWLRSLAMTSGPNDNLDQWEVPDPVYGRQVVGAAPGRVGIRRVLPDTGLRHHLLHRFRQQMNEGAAVEAVTDLKQRAGESVDEFYDRVVIAMDIKNHRVGEQERRGNRYKERLRDDVYTFFAAGMNNDIRQQALGGPEAGKPTTALALLEAARNAELERKRVKKPKFLSSLDQQQGPSEDQQDGGREGEQQQEPLSSYALHELMYELDAIRSRISGLADVACWNCGQRGHYSFDCTVKGNRPAGGRGGKGGFTSAGRGRGGARPSAAASGGGSKWKPAAAKKAPPKRGATFSGPAATGAKPKKQQRRVRKQLHEVWMEVPEGEEDDDLDTFVDEDAGPDVVVEGDYDAEDLEADWTWPPPNGS